MLIEYQKLKKQEVVSRLVKPVGLMFSEFYFYMTAFIERLDVGEEDKDTLYPAIYRIDRIKGYRVLDEHFSVPYKDRFQEGEFRKRVQFMAVVEKSDCTATIVLLSKISNTINSEGITEDIKIIAKALKDSLLMEMPTAKWVLPTPGGPSRITFSARAAKARVASSSICRLSMEG